MTAQSLLLLSACGLAAMAMLAVALWDIYAEVACKGGN